MILATILVYEAKNSKFNPKIKSLTLLIMNELHNTITIW